VRLLPRRVTTRPARSDGPSDPVHPGWRREPALLPGLAPVVGVAGVPEGHRVDVVVPAATDAAHQCSEPRSVVDAVHGTASLPLGFLGKHQIVEIDVGVRPVAVSPNVRRVDRHSPAPLCVDFLLNMIGTTPCQL
jgi:hypothetical protein